MKWVVKVYRKIKTVLNTPWKIRNEIMRMLYVPICRMYMRLNGVKWGSNWKVYGRPVIQRYKGSEIFIGNGLNMRNWRYSNPLGIWHRSILSTRKNDAKIEIGDNFSCSGVTICAHVKIQIGDNVVIGCNCTIIDTDFHPIENMERRINPNEGRSVPVVIEDDVFVGMNVMVLKGIKIGKGAVVGAGSLVNKNIPNNSIAIGNPIEIKKVN